MQRDKCRDPQESRQWHLKSHLAAVYSTNNWPFTDSQNNDSLVHRTVLLVQQLTVFVGADTDNMTQKVSRHVKGQARMWVRSVCGSVCGSRWTGIAGTVTGVVVVYLVCIKSSRISLQTRHTTYHRPIRSHAPRRLLPFLTVQIVRAAWTVEALSSTVSSPVLWL